MKRYLFLALFCTIARPATEYFFTGLASLLGTGIDVEAKAQLLIAALEPAREFKDQALLHALNLAPGQIESRVASLLSQAPSQSTASGGGFAEPKITLESVSSNFKVCPKPGEHQGKGLAESGAAVSDEMSMEEILAKIAAAGEAAPVKIWDPAPKANLAKYPHVRAVESVQQRGDHTCGPDAIFNALGVSRAFHAGLPIDHSIVKNLSTAERSVAPVACSLLEEVEIYRFADQHGLDVQAAQLIKQVDGCTVLGLIPRDIGRLGEVQQKLLAQEILEFKEGARVGPALKQFVVRFGTEGGSGHWILISLLKQADKPEEIIFMNSTNVFDEKEETILSMFYNALFGEGAK